MPLRGKFREEMDYLRRLGREFARDNPQLSQFLGDEAADPDVERLLEGFAFLTAKLRLKIEDDLPELTHSLLQLLWPNYLRPLPSVTIMRFDPIDRAITTRQVIPKGTQVLSRPVEGMRCEFRTCSDVTIYPLRIQDVSDAHTREKSIVRVDLAAASAMQGLLEQTYEGDATFPYDAPIPGGTTDFTQFILGAQNAGSDSLMLASGEQEALQVATRASSSVPTSPSARASAASRTSWSPISATTPTGWCSCGRTRRPPSTCPCTRPCVPTWPPRARSRSSPRT